MSVEKIDELTPIVDGLAENKASVFAYTEQAYRDNDVTGVSQYDFSKEQNVPDKNSTDTNPQVLTKGFRSQGSSIARNFINHFIGRFSYNLNKIIDVFQSFITSYKSDYQKNGFMYNATLPYQVGDVCMDVWSDNTFAFFVRTGNGGSTGVRPMVASDIGWTVNEHWSCLGTPKNISQTFVLRDSAGRAQVAAPSAANDIANKQYVDSTASSEADGVQTNLTSHINTQASGVHGSTSAATANKIIIRDSAGRAQVANPSAATDIANKDYVDDKVAEADNFTNTVYSSLNSHTNSRSNPHGVILSQLGVTATASELNKLDGFTGSAAKLNFTNKVTSDIQSQINAIKASGGAPGAPGKVVWTTSSSLSLQPGWYLIIAVGGGGGGGGGSSYGGGGGGSGQCVSTLLYLKSAVTLQCSIGKGGSGGLFTSNGTNGFVTKVMYNGVYILLAGGGFGGEAGENHPGMAGLAYINGSSGTASKGGKGADLGVNGTMGDGGDGGNPMVAGRNGQAGAVGYIKFA